MTRSPVKERHCATRRGRGEREGGRGCDVQAGQDGGWEREAGAGSRGGRVGNAELFPDDVDFAFVTGDALADSDGEPAKFGNLVGEAVEALVVTVETLVDGFEMLVDEPILSIEAFVLGVEALVDCFEVQADEPVLSVEAIAVDGDEAAEGGDDGGKGDQGVTVFLEVGWHEMWSPGWLSYARELSTVELRRETLELLQVAVQKNSVHKKSCENRTFCAKPLQGKRSSRATRRAWTSWAMRRTANSQEMARSWRRRASASLSARSARASMRST